MVDPLWEALKRVPEFALGNVARGGELSREFLEGNPDPNVLGSDPLGGSPLNAGIIGMEAARNSPRLAQLIQKFYGISPETRTIMRAESPYHAASKYGVPLRYYTPIEKQRMWSNTLNKDITEFLPHKLEGPGNVQLSTLFEESNIPNMDLLNNFLGRVAGGKFGSPRGSVSLLPMSAPIDRFTKPLDELVKSIPKKYRGFLNNFQRSHEGSRTSFGELREAIIGEIMKQEGINNLILGTKSGKPSQIIKRLE